MEHALVILCGGNSVRMGSDKALLPFGDCCLIEYLVRKFSPHFSNIYLSVKRKGDYAHLNLDVTEIADIYPNAGPMSGLFSALSMMREDSAFFLSVNTPFLEPQTALSLLTAIGDAQICTLEQKETPSELPAGVYTKSIITTVGKCLLLRRLTFENLCDRCVVRYVTAGELMASDSTTLQTDTRTQSFVTSQNAVKAQLFNMDTREDYYRALARLQSVPLS